jgi:hypothetical protein
MEVDIDSMLNALRDDDRLSGAQLVETLLPGDDVGDVGRGVGVGDDVIDYTIDSVRSGEMSGAEGVSLCSSVSDLDRRNAALESA